MKNLLLVLLITFINVHFMLAQQAKIDSLTIEFQKAEQDTTKADILAKIGIAAYYTDFKKATYYNDSLIRFSKNRSEKHEALGYRMQGTLQLIDGNYDNSEASYLKSLDIFYKIKDKGYQGALIANLATLYARQNEIERADSTYLKAIEVLKDVKNDKQSINCFINLGINALNANRLESATNYFIQTLNEADELDDDYNRFYAFDRLGITYLKRNLIKKAEEHFINALELGEKLQDKSGLASVYNSLGFVYDEELKHEKALDYFNKSKEMSEAINDKEQLSRAYINLGRQYEFLGNYNKSKSKFNKALEIAKSIKDSVKITAGNLHLASLLLKVKDTFNAGLRIREAKLFHPKNSDVELHNIYKKISDEYAKSPNYAKAYEFLKKFTIINDSLYYKNNTSKIAEIEARYQVEKKEKEIAQNKQLILKQELELKNKQRTLLFYLALLFLGVIMGLFYLYKKVKTQLEKQKLLNKFKDGVQKYLYDKYDLKDNEYKLWLKIVDGLSEKELAEHFFKSIDTIKNWRKSLYSKLKPNNKPFKQKNAIDLYNKEISLYESLKN